MIQKLTAILIIPLLFGMTCLESAQEITPDFNSYKVLNAITGEELNLKTYSEEVEIIKTHLAVASEIKKILVKNGIDISQIDISLYLTELSVSDNHLKRKWQPISNIHTVTSPWIELNRTLDGSQKSKIEIRVDASYIRLMMDLFSDSSQRMMANSFRQIPDIDQNCFRKIEISYRESLMNSENLRVNKIPDAFDCAPESTRDSLFSLFRSANQTNLFPMTESVYQKLDSCLNIVQKYYKKLYPRLVFRALQILEEQHDSEPKWWAEIAEQVNPIQECPQAVD